MARDYSLLSDGSLGPCTVFDYNDNIIDFEAAMHVADSELMEQIDTENPQEFIEEYARLHAEKYDGEEFAPYYGLAW